MIKRSDVVSKLQPPDGFIVSEDSNGIMETLKKISGKDIDFTPTVALNEEILYPFEGLHEAMNAAMENQSKQHTKNKWDKINLSSFSPKYVKALEIIQNRQKIKTENTVDAQDKQTSLSNECPFFDEEFQAKIDEMVKENCSMRIELPRGIFKNYINPYNPCNDILLKKTPLSTKRKMNGVKQLEPINIKQTTLLQEEEKTFQISPTNYHMFRDYDDQVDTVVNPFTWQELDDMKIKCGNWLNKNFNTPEAPKMKK